MNLSLNLKLTYICPLEFDESGEEEEENDDDDDDEEEEEGHSNGQNNKKPAVSLESPSTYCFFTIRILLLGPQSCKALACPRWDIWSQGWQTPEIWEKNGGGCSRPAA